MSSRLKRPKKGRTTPPFEQLPLECLLYMFRFLHPVDIVFRSKLYNLKESNYDSLLSMVHFDLHRQQYQHLRVHRSLHQQGVACTGESIYAYCPIIFAYSTLAVSHLPKQPVYYMCCPRDQQTIILTSYKPYISYDDEDEPYDRTDDFVLTDPEGMQVYNSLPDPSYRILIQSDYTMNWYGIHCIGDIVEGVVMSYGRCPTEKHPTKLDTWSIPDFA